MYFNSIDFAIFLPIVFLLYWFVLNRNIKIQNLLLLAASYFFYGWWDWRFLSLILFSSTLDYFIGLHIHMQNKQIVRKVLLVSSITVNIGFLCFFKYYNFFLDSFISAFSFVGVILNPRSLNIILPVGISFYTFQTLSYSIDVYKRKLEPSRDFIAFAAFVSFFPQLVAGPIERATNLLPQFGKKRQFRYLEAVDGLRQILWGLFKKIVIADNCAEIANEVFNNTGNYSGIIMLVGAVAFTFQIYGDFSGYSDIAIGTAKLFGFNLMKNFAFPYFSRDIAEFWRRWHISLSTWFRDYLYIPLGGSRGSKYKVIRNTFIIFVVSGFWHGANWTFVVWGGLNALYFLPLLLMKKNRTNIEIVAKGKLLPNPKEISSIVVTFSLTVFAWIFFRAENISHAMEYIKRIFRTPLGLKATIIEAYNFLYWKIGFVSLLYALIFIIMEWYSRENIHTLEKFGLKWKRSYRLLLYFSITIVIFWYSGKQQEFIYFQF